MYSSCGQRKACFLEISCRLVMAIWDRLLAMPPGVCCASPVQTTRHVGVSIATEATSRSPPYCPLSITTMTSFCCHVSSVEKGLALCPAHEPPVISRKGGALGLFVWNGKYQNTYQSATYSPQNPQQSVQCRDGGLWGPQGTRACWQNFYCPCSLYR